VSGEDTPPGFVLSLAERFGLSFTEAPEGATPVEAERECDRLLAALKEATDEQEANRRVRDEEFQRMEHWLERVNRAPKEREAWLFHMLKAVAPFVPRFGKKSRDLPHGTVAWRTKPRRVEIVDPDTALAWAKARGLPTVTKESVAHAVIEGAWKTGMGVPPGCRVVEAEEVFHAQPSEVG
jgi:hypothetical protein